MAARRAPARLNREPPAARFGSVSPMAATHQRLAASAAADLAEARERTLALVAPLSDADVETRALGR